MMLGTALTEASTAWTIGPMFHLNFSDKTTDFTWGIEAAYYVRNAEQTADPIYLGVNLGFEVLDARTIAYSQASFHRYAAAFGAALGPAWTIDRKAPPEWGVQADAWLCVFGGFNNRIRVSKSTEWNYSPGVFVKAPVYFTESIHGPG